MPFVLIFLGVTLIATALRGTTGVLFTTVKSDFTGSDNFIYWLLSLMVIGSVGYIKRLQPVANLFMFLVLLVMFIANKGGFFTQFMTAIKTPSTNCGQAGSDQSTAAAATGANNSTSGTSAGATGSNTSSTNDLTSTPTSANSTIAGTNLFNFNPANLGNAAGLQSNVDLNNALNMGADYLGD